MRPREDGESLRRMVEHAADLLSRHTPEGACLYASPACRALLGYEPEELVRLSADELVHELVHPDDLAAIRRGPAPGADGPDVAALAYRVRRKDSRYVWFETTA